MTEDEIEVILRGVGAEYRHMGRGVNAWCIDGDLMPLIEALLAATAPVAPVPYFDRRAVERSIEAMKAPQPGMQLNDNKERPTLPVGTLERMLKIIDMRGGA